MKKLTKIICTVLSCMLMLTSTLFLGACAPETPPILSTATCTVKTGENGVDFVMDFALDRDVKVLQITDTQLQNWYGARTPQRHEEVMGIFANGMAKDHEIRAWRYVREAFDKVKPDIIVATGDNIYGELDDDGRMWLEFIEVMDSFQVPWLMVFGNHDNESAKGVTWQIDQFKNSKYCIFKQGGLINGNSNYNVLVTRRGAPQFLLYMMDTNGCHVVNTKTGEGLNVGNVDMRKLKASAGFGSDQVDWMVNSSKKAFEKYGNVPTLLFQHIPLYEVRNAIVSKYEDTCETLPFYPSEPGDLGVARAIATGFASIQGFWKKLKEMNCKGVFFGHQHTIATSIVYDGIRLTYGLKTSTYDSHASDMLGATKITLNSQKSDVDVVYVYTSYDYETNRVFE